MPKILIFGIIFAIAAYLFSEFVKKSGNNQEPDSTPLKEKEDIGKYFYLKKSLFTPAEYIFYRELQKQNNNEFVVHSKVRLEDIVGVAKGVGEKFNAMRNHIKSRHVDFAIIGSTGDILAVIELDDKSHDTDSAQRGDEIKNQIFQFNQVKFYRVQVGQVYAEEINKILTEVKGA
jgi:hypothetical protein